MRFFPIGGHTLVGINAVVVVAGALALAGASAVSSSPVSARPLSGAPALKQAQAAGNDAGAVSEPATTSSPDILAPADPIVGEGDDHVDLTVTLSDQSDNPVSVHYATADSTAAAGVCGNSGDYAAVSDTLNFAPGETTKVVRVQIVDCPVVEGFEAFTFNLSAAVNGVIARASSRISIVDNDTIVPTPKLFVRDAIVDEKDGNALVSVLLGGPAGQASDSTVTVNFATANGTAHDGDDYSAAGGTLTFEPGDTAKTVAVHITDDNDEEGQENFFFTLSGASNADLATGTGTVTIGASDTPDSTDPDIRAPADLVLGEADGFIDLPVTLSARSLNPVSVHYQTFDSTAAAGVCGNSGDYVAAIGTLNFAPGETTKVVRVQIIDCPVVEGFEAFTFKLDTEHNGVISRASGRISIVDNDTIVATPKLFVRDAIVDEKDGNALVSVLLGGPAGQASNSTVTVHYATANGTATRL